jgi:transcriptional regulator with XRE-family HTH domain
MQLSPSNLKTIRKAAGISPERAGDATLRTSQSVHNWESGAAIPSARTLAILADLYGCSPAAFFVIADRVAV